MNSDELKLLMFGEGPWMNEPDKLEFKHNGLDCRILRNACGNLCGYVKLPKNHPWEVEDIFYSSADVHGGITYAEKEEDGFWIGFDCAHSGDFIPSAKKILPDLNQKHKMPDSIKILAELKPEAEKMWNIFTNNDQYRDISYVEQECRNLAEQVIKSSLNSEAERCTVNAMAKGSNPLEITMDSL